MISEAPTAPTSKRMLWTGRIITALVVLFMLFDGVVKVLQLPSAVEGTMRLGYPAIVVLPLGIIVLLCTILYVVPRTCVLGAILLTGYLGGATATQVRVGSSAFFFPVAVGVLAWAGLYLRDARLRVLIWR